MPYDEILATRIRQMLKKLDGYEEKTMFGGVGFLLDGNMACGVHQDNLIVRVGIERYSQAMQRPYTRPFDITGKAMKGWLMVAPPGYQSEQDLEAWVKLGVDFARTLPPK
jgi:TfoX/Sxy family transcriptional regulator of competence genes